MITVSQYGILIILSLSLVFHICVLLKFISYKIVWGGKLKSDKEMYRFETVSILINLFFLFIILLQSGILSIGIPAKIMTGVLWTMSALFLLNTFGNVMSKNKTEKIIFSPITIILTIFSVVLAMNN